MNVATAAACASVSARSTAATGPPPPSTPRRAARSADEYGTVNAGPGTARSRPSVVTTATSMPSSDVPLINPIATVLIAVPSIVAPDLSPRADCATRPALSEGPFAAHDENPGTIMTKPRSAFLHTLLARGFLHQCTDLEGLDALARTGQLVAYVGYDCTADSLHIGNLVSVMMLRWLQKTGHKPIVLIGGGTTKIGDPSGKDEARKLLDEAGITRNMAGIRQSAEKFFSFGDGPSDAITTNNAEWLDALGYIAFLRDIGGHFSVNRMLT